MSLIFQKFKDKKAYKIFYKNKFFVASIFFVILQLLILYKYTYLSGFSNMLWFCSHASMILAIGFFFKNFNLIKAIISVGLIIQFFWFLDFLSNLVFGFFIFGATDYMFLDTSLFSYIISLFEHLTCLIALLLTYKIKTERKVLIYAFIYLIILLIVTILFSGEGSNYNFVRNLLIFNELTFSGYQFFWIFSAMTFIVLPVYFFQIWLYNLHKS
ncbi:MAG: hypothetical protein ACOC1K_01690 [Nanoarchaeota archaeon]